MKWHRTAEGYAGTNGLRHDEYPVIRPVLTMRGKPESWRLLITRAVPGLASWQWPTEDCGSFPSLSAAKAAYGRPRPNELGVVGL